MATTSKFYNEIKSSVIEREVEDVYNKGITLYFDAPIEHPFACDGFLNTKTENGKLLRLLIEYKFEKALTSRLERAKILVQVLFYLKRFENNGLILPNVIMIGDKNECFVMHSNDIIPYLDENVDWSVAPSNAHNLNPAFVAKVASDESINPFIFKIDENFSFKAVADKIRDLAENVQRFVHITEHNIDVIFEYFKGNVIKDAEKIQANDLVGIFMGVIKNEPEYYLHPTKKNTLVTPLGSFPVKTGGFASFFSYFSRKYTPQEKNRLDGISDRLIENTNRRIKGEFYTPTLFVDYAHNMIARELGENWKDEYVVWDCAAGTKNLTRDYRFKELYSSTLENAELEISAKYNPNSTAFQFDFLNDGLDKLPQGLKDAFADNKPIVFFINPPYGTAGSGLNKEHKKGMNDTIIRKEMKSCGLLSGAENLQHQFLFRITEIKKKYNLTNCVIALFSKPIFLTGGKQKDFLNYLCSNFSFSNGVLFNAGHFANVSADWGITFNIWKTGITFDKNAFPHTLIDIKDGEIVEMEKKNLYNLNGLKKASDWVRKEVKGLKTFDKPCFSSGIVIKNEGKTYGTIFEGALGYFLNDSNNVAKNAQSVGLFSSSFTNGHGLGIAKSNLLKCTALFTARKAVKGNWINDKDEYLEPNTEHSAYRQFESDSLVYSIFNTSSNQSSLRNVNYKGKTYDIPNNFFFMGKDEIMELANNSNNDICYEGAKTDTDRYVFELLNSMELSEKAKAVLEKARELVAESFSLRQLFDEEHPEYQINNWDCGWYQIKALLKEYCPDKLKEFSELYRDFENQLIPQIYELGFLK